jgi:hypothetical protein
MNLKILLAGLGASAALLLVLGGGLVAGGGQAQASGVGRPAPAFELPAVSGDVRLTSGASAASRRS